MKHGIHIREHKHWNTKTIYNNGRVMRIYRRQPKTIRFSSPLVNDFNQHLCGGWSMSDIKDETEATLQQLVAGRKPFAWIFFGPDQEATVLAARQRLEAAGLVTDLRERACQGHQTDHDGWDFLACRDIRVREIGDLRALSEDYADLPAVDVWPYADRALSTFFDGWDSPPLPLWLTGLILGYPVENTISCYRE